MTLGPFCFLVHVLFTRMCTGGDDPAEAGEYCAFCVCVCTCVHGWTLFITWGPFCLFSCACACSRGPTRVVTILLKAVSIALFVCVSTCVHGQTTCMTLAPFCFLMHVLFTRMCTGGDDPAEGCEYCAFCVFEYLCSWTDHMHDLGPFLFSCACPVHADVHGW